MPRGNDVHTRAARRIREHSRQAAEAFESQPIRDGLHDDVLEDTQLAQLEDAIAEMEDLRDRRRTDENADAPVDPTADVVDAIETLQTTVDHRLAELQAERCRTVLDDGAEWVARGWCDREAVAEATAEATTWLLEHHEVCLRAFGEVPVDGAGDQDTSASAGETEVGP